MPNENSSQHKGLEAFYEQINIELFNDIVAFVTATTEKDTVLLYRRLHGVHLWYAKSDGDNIQKKHGFRYLGELLERYADKMDPGIRETRAIALAVAYTKEYITSSMYGGSQLDGFIRKITRLSPGDIYLKGALYLYRKNEPAGSGLYDELTQTVYTRTEDVIFAVSLFDDFEQSMPAFKPQLINLLGAARTMSAMGNLGIYAWIIRQLYAYHKSKGFRSKDMALFRTLIELPGAFVKAESKHHAALLGNGYTAEEIIYLNSGIIQYSPTHNSIRTESIAAEKIAVEFCKTFINSENTHHPDAYEYLAWLLKRYSSFGIRINGHEGIYEAIKGSIAIANPQTLLLMYRLFPKKDLFRFDILDEKWDLLSSELNPDEYLELFESQLVANTGFTGAEISARISRYETLTKTPYMPIFNQEHHYNRAYVFSLLVEKGVIDILTAFESIPGLENVGDSDKDAAKPQMLHYLKNYLKGIHSREAFDFFKAFFKTHSFDDMHRFFTDGSPAYGHARDRSHFFKGGLYKGSKLSYGDEGSRFDIRRTFLSEDEHRELFGWLDDYMFRYHADKYAEYAVLMLLDPFVTTLFPKAELRQVFDMVAGLDNNIVHRNIYGLKRGYLSPAELQAERAAEEALAQEKEREEHEQEIRKLERELSERFDGSFKSLLSFMYRHGNNHHTGPDAIRMAAGCLGAALGQRSHMLDTEELGRFLQFGGELLKKGAITYDTLITHIMSTKEDKHNAENSGTPEPDTDAE